MTREEIKEKLKEVIRMAAPDVAETVENCGDDAVLATDLGLNSVGMLFIVIAIEEFFGITFDNVGFGDFRTVGDVVDYIAAQQ